MTKVYFNNRYSRHEGDGQVYDYISSVNLLGDDFMLFGNIGINRLHIQDGSLNAKNATITNDFLTFLAYNSKVENVNKSHTFFLYNNSSLSSSSVNLLDISGNNTIDGIVSAKEVKLRENTALKIDKDGVLKVGDKNALDFSKISGEGKIFDEKTQAFYDTDGNAINNANDLFQTNIINHNFAVAKAIEKVKDKTDIYIDGHEHQKYDVDLLNIEMINNDNFL